MFRDHTSKAADAASAILQEPAQRQSELSVKLKTWTVTPDKTPFQNKRPSQTILEI